MAGVDERSRVRASRAVTGDGSSSGGRGDGGLLAPGASAALGRLAVEYWESHLRSHPIEATQYGVRSHDHRMPDVSPGARAAERVRLAGLERAVADLDDDRLSGEERLTRIALLTQVRADIDLIDADAERWTVDPLEGTPVVLLNIQAFQRVQTPEDGDAMAARWNAIGAYVDAQIANLVDSLRAGFVAVRHPVERVIDELDELDARPDEALAFLQPLRVERPEWPVGEVEEFGRRLREAVATSIRPALGRYRRALAETILPQARPPERPGIMHVPGGDEAYARLIRVHTSLDVDPARLHATGLAEVARTRDELAELGRRVFGIRTVEDLFARLRSDPTLYFASREEVTVTAVGSLARARAALADWFGVLPLAECVVVPMSAHEERHSSSAYYRDPDPGGRRPGQFFVNTSAPETRARFEAEALAFHEGVPGHHLQVAIGQEVAGLPEFRRHLGVTSFWEGWALYAERLADEMGLYTDDLARVGMLSAETLLACRLVIDTGMHALGWTRDRAISFLLDNSSLAAGTVATEVDRYIVWPGQALAYKTGQLELVRLRRQTEDALGPRFDVRTFHDTVLAHGAIPLVALDRVVAEHVAAATAGRATA